MVENHPWDIKTVGRGTNSDDSKEIIGSGNDGYYIDGRNQRPVSGVGQSGASEKIKGETIKYPAQAISGNWECMGSIVINSHIIEFWADKAVAQPSLIRIDGNIACQHATLPIDTFHPLQMDKNEDCDGGEVLVTNFNTPPMIFNIQDMINAPLSATPQKYFTEFILEEYQINLMSPLDIPVFIELVPVGGGGGLPPGSYEYQIRYSNRSGDRTNFSQRSVMIPVAQSLSNASLQYPGTRTFGGPPNPSHGTSYAVKLRFRCTNLFDYDFIEIKRVAHNQGAGIGFLPTSTIVAKIDVTPGEISVKEYLDPVEQNSTVALSDKEDTQVISFIESCKAIRYSDRRAVLMNVKLPSKSWNPTFEDVNGKVMFPIVESLGKNGFKDPWVHAYKKHYMGGERYGFAVNCYDGVGGKGFAVKVPGFTNYQYPNRRDPIDADSQQYSTGSVKATRIDNTIGQTFEVFDLANAISKTDKCSFKNIYRGDSLGFKGHKDASDVTEDCDESTGEIENHGANAGLISVGGFNEVYPYYHVYHPLNQNDPDVTGHNYITNPQVSKTDDDSDGEPYNPQGFAPNYFSHGMALAGLDGFPKWAKAFSVVRTHAAKRVVAQGLGMFSLIPAIYDMIGNDKLCTKWKNKFWFYSPDIEQGVISPELVNDIVDNPQNYKLQFVSPLGFFTETYNFEHQSIGDLPFVDPRSRLIDMISYARILRDNNSINPGDNSMGYPGGDGYRYVGYGKNRNTSVPATFTGGDQGNKLFDLFTAKRKKEGRGNYLELETVNGIYDVENTGGSGNNDFEDAGMQNWTEPFYIINIISEGNIIRDQNVQGYKSTGHYQKLESIIGQGTGLPGQKYILVDERWEDCISDLSPTSPNAAADRFCYIKRAGTNIVEKWINISFKTIAQKSVIQADITSFGSWGPGVTGMYRHTNTGNRFFELIFDVGYEPQQGDKILVRYDKTAPIKIFGGDAVVGETIFAPIDREADADDNASSTHFAFGVGWPYRVWKLNPRIFVVKDADAIVDAIQDEPWHWLAYLRQMCMMFTVESRACVHLAHNVNYPTEYFPLSEYVMRPNRWDKDKSYEDQNLFRDYGYDYGTQEKDQWKFGGFRFLQSINPDYSNEPPIEFFSKPAFGFREKTEFCDGIMWSLPRAGNSMGAPGLKTFPANNFFEIDDDQGSIKRAWEATTDKGENLYAICDRGICLLVTKKSILSDLTGGDIAYMAADGFIKHQLWITKDIGATDEMWRGIVEASVPILLENGGEVYKEALFIPNKESVFRFMDNTALDIGRMKYHNRVYHDVLNKVSPGYTTPMTGGYDKLHQEYWFQCKIRQGDIRVPVMVVFGAKNNAWHGKFDYSFDRYSTLNNQIFGHRSLETYLLDSGFTINGQPIRYEILKASAPQQPIDKEFCRIKINTIDMSTKPDRIEFYDENQVLLCFLDVSQGPLYLKNYRGWEKGIPRKLPNAGGFRDRVQGRVLIYKIIHTLQEDFGVINTAIQYKPIKG